MNTALTSEALQFELFFKYFHHIEDTLQNTFLIIRCCDFFTFLLWLKYHPTLVWKMFLVSLQSDWTLLPVKTTHIIQPLAWKYLWKGVGNVICFYSAYRKSEQCLGSNHNERFAEVPDHLSPQQVEVLSRSGWVDHSHVHIVTVHTLFFTVTHLRDKTRQVSNHLQFR